MSSCACDCGGVTVSYIEFERRVFALIIITVSHSIHRHRRIYAEWGGAGDARLVPPQSQGKTCPYIRMVPVFIFTTLVWP